MADSSEYGLFTFQFSYTSTRVRFSEIFIYLTYSSINNGIPLNFTVIHNVTGNGF
jgi:hypothetical protein